MKTLATAYRPQKFEDVTSQASVIQILQRQLDNHDFSNVYLFCGPSGCGKTTIARIFANEINNGVGTPIEIDGASNNGVDNVKLIISEAQQRAIDSEYKIVIMDECHMLTTQAWNALLKCIEEPPKYTIFMFCTTDPQKIPATILGRVMRFNLTRISADKICERLCYISREEGFVNYEDACSYISRICGGGMRDGIALLEKCANYNPALSMNNVVEALGDYSYEVYFRLINYIIDGNVGDSLATVQTMYNQGADLKTFISKFLEFCLDLAKYSMMSDVSVTKIPQTLVDQLKTTTSISNAPEYFFYVVNGVLKIKNDIKNDPDAKSTIEVGIINLARCNK